MSCGPVTLVQQIVLVNWTNETQLFFCILVLLCTLFYVNINIQIICRNYDFHKTLLRWTLNTEPNANKARFLAEPLTCRLSCEAGRLCPKTLQEVVPVPLKIIYNQRLPINVRKEKQFNFSRMDFVWYALYTHGNAMSLIRFDNHITHISSQL